jgi:hypothetical protein
MLLLFFPYFVYKLAMCYGWQEFFEGREHCKYLLPLSAFLSYSPIVTKYCLGDQAEFPPHPNLVYLWGWNACLWVGSSFSDGLAETGCRVATRQPLHLRLKDTTSSARTVWLLPWQEQKQPPKWVYTHYRVACRFPENLCHSQKGHKYFSPLSLPLISMIWEFISYFSCFGQEQKSLCDCSIGA